MRKRIYEIIEPGKNGSTLSRIYDIVMLCTILLSLVPLTVRKITPTLLWIDCAAALIFLADYILRLITADLKLKKSAAPFLRYPFTPMAIIDLLSMLPSVLLIAGSLGLIHLIPLFHTFKIFKLLRLFRGFRVLRIFKVFRYSRNFVIIARVLKEQRNVLAAVGVMAVGYVFVSALIMYNVEPSTFPTFLDALYWATVSLTTIGYGDFAPVTAVGKLITMCSSVLGVAVIALPAGVITAGYMAEISKDKTE